MTKQHRGFSHGATFDWEAIRRELEAADWEDDPDDDRKIRTVWLGTVFGVTPSGKVYAPFACSNVAGDCPACDGKGEREPRTGRRARKRAAARSRDYSRRTLARKASPEAQARYVKRVHEQRQKASNAQYAKACAPCDSTGSVSAARDARWTEALEQAADAIGAYVYYGDDSIFIAQSRDPEDVEDEDGVPCAPRTHDNDPAREDFARGT